MTMTTIMIMVTMMMTMTMTQKKIKYTLVIFMESSLEASFKSQGYFEFNSLVFIPESFMYPHLNCFTFSSWRRNCRA